MKLTPRQEQIVELVCGPRRLSYPAVAVELGISLYTVQHHAQQIRWRLGCREARARVVMEAYYRENVESGA